MALGLIKNTIKWSAKLGIAGGTIYIANDAGLFGTADQAESGVKKLEKDYHEGLKEVNEVIIPQYVPKELLDYVPEVPKIDVKEFMPDIDINFTSDIRGLWNKGVIFHIKPLEKKYILYCKILFDKRKKYF